MKIRKCLKPIVEDSSEDKIKKLFSYKIDYKKFQDMILAPERRAVYCNYNENSFFALKETIAKKYKGSEDREIKTYKAIADLYVSRFLLRYEDMNDSLYLASLNTIALIIAIKTSFDHDAINLKLFYHRLPEFKDSFEVFKAMELQFLQAINFDISVKEIFKPEFSQDIPKQGYIDAVNENMDRNEILDTVHHENEQPFDQSVEYDQNLSQIS